MALKTPLKTVKGIGSAAGEGSHHFWVQRVSGIALVPLSLWLVYVVVNQIIGEPWGLRQWLYYAHNSFLLILFITASYYHAYLGLKVVIEDYVHNEAIKISSFIIMQLGIFFIAGATIFAILDIYFRG